MAFCQIHGLVITNKWPNVSVPLEKFAVYASFINNNVDVSCEFSYNNTSSELIETEFVFPLEATAAVYFLEAIIGSKRLTAICRERIEAETAYTEAVESGHTAFMMQEDYRMGDTFKMKLGNIPPKESIKLTFKYVIPLYLRKIDLTLDRFVGLKDPFVSVFSMPARIGERYDPNPGTHGDRSASSKLAAKMSFIADIYADGQILSVTSAHHKFLVDFEEDEKKRAKVSLDGDMDLSHDFEMELAVENPYALWAPCELGEADKGGFLGMHCVTANFLPDIPQSKAPDGDKLEIIFVLDRSGSMSGTRMSKTKESLLLFLKSLPRKCRFQIVGFGSMFRALFNEPVDYTKENLDRALEYQSSLEADMGGTEVFQALKSVYDTPITGAGWYRQIIFLTDGEIYNQDEVIGLVARNQSNARLFAIGLGDEVSTSLIWGVARAGRGTASFIRNNDNLRSTTMSVLKAALQPMLTDVELKWDVQSGGKALDVLTVPSQLPPLFSGNYMAAFGLIPAPPAGESNASDIQGTLTLNYKLDGQIHSMVAKLQSLPVEHSSLGLHRLAAKAQIFELVDKHSALSEDDGGRAELRQQIVDISTNTNVISPFTSFIGVDPDKQENFEKPIRNPIFPHAVVEADGGPANFVAFSKMATPSAVPSGLRSRGLAPAAPMMFCSTANDSRMCKTETAAAPASGRLFGAASASGGIFGATAFHKCAAAEEEVMQTTDIVVRLAELQDFSGFWNMDKKLSELLTLTTGQMTSTRPSEVKDDRMWATALVIAYLQVRMSDRREEWEMMVQKATDWLQMEHNWTDASPLLGDAEKALAKLLSSQ